MMQNAEEIAANIQRAKTSIQAAKDMLEKEYFDIAASRAYYAAFYAASALLLKNGTDTNKHSGVIALIHQLFVKTGRLDKEHGKNLNWLFELRGIGDYGMSEHVSAGEAYKSIKVAEDFLKAALKILEE
jgi:uncharacterized protein (UPF0332 family)